MSVYQKVKEIGHNTQPSTQEKQALQVRKYRKMAQTVLNTSLYCIETRGRGGGEINSPTPHTALKVSTIGGWP